MKKDTLRKNSEGSYMPLKKVLAYIATAATISIGGVGCSEPGVFYNPVNNKTYTQDPNSGKWQSWEGGNPEESGSTRKVERGPSKTLFNVRNSSDGRPLEASVNLY